MNPELRALRPYPMAELQRRKEALRARGVDLIDFGTGDPIEPTPPAIRAALVDAVPAVSQYPSVAGTPVLRRAVAGYLQRRFGVALDPERAILPSAGSKEAIFHLPLALLDPASARDTVIYGTPAYPVYQTGALFAGGRAHAVTLQRGSGFRLDLTALPTSLLDRCALAWINYPHNPTGACVDHRYLAEQAACCREHGIVLVSDECYADLWFDPADPAPPGILEVAVDGVLAIGSCSKRSGMTGYRSGFIAGDPALIADYRRWRSTMGVGSPAFIEAAAAVAWDDDDHPAERRARFAHKRRILAAGLERRGLAVEPSAAGLYIWAALPSTTDSDTYAARCLDAGIVVSPGAFFGPGGDGFIRLALVPSLDDCARALERWP